MWSVATAAPPADWVTPSFDASRWPTAAGAFGDPAVAAAGGVTDVGTRWTAGDLWLRQTFTLAAVPAGHLSLFVRHSGALQAYVNGTPAADLDRPVSDYAAVPLPPSARLRAVANLIAIHCAAGQGPAYVDAGITAGP